MSMTAHEIYSLGSLFRCPLPTYPHLSTDTDPHTDAQEYQTNSGFLKAPVKGTLLKWQTSINLVFSYARFTRVTIVLELFKFHFVVLHSDNNNIDIAVINSIVL